MDFDIRHEIAAPLAAVERAVTSPNLGDVLASRLQKAIESVETIEHARVTDDDGRAVVRRVLRFQANAPLSIFKSFAVARDMMWWDEISIYDLATHRSTWTVQVRPEGRKYFRSGGTYELEAFTGDDGAPRTRRIVRGSFEIKFFMGSIAEKMALREVRKTYEAEAEAIESLVRDDAPRSSSRNATVSEGHPGSTATPDAT